MPTPWVRSGICKLYINGFTAALLCAIAFAATAGGEFVREGVRKPYSIRQVLYSNSLRQDELERLRKIGSVDGRSVSAARWTPYPNDQLKTGAKCLTASSAASAIPTTGPMACSS